MSIPRIACAAILHAALAAAGAEPIAPVEVRRIAPAPAPDATHALALELNTFRGTRWSTEAIVAAVTQAGALLAQCGVALAAADLRVVEAPRRFHYYETSVSRELVRALPTRRPAVFFVEDTHNRPAFDAEAIGLANSASRPELANTLWIAYGARDLAHAIAHELTHVLSDSGEHSHEPGNLMQPETAPGSTRLTPAQCERMRTRGVANGLLVRTR